MIFRVIKLHSNIFQKCSFHCNYFCLSVCVYICLYMEISFKNLNNNNNCTLNHTLIRQWDNDRCMSPDILAVRQLLRDEKVGHYTLPAIPSPSCHSHDTSRKTHSLRTGVASGAAIYGHLPTANAAQSLKTSPPLSSYVYAWLSTDEHEIYTYLTQSFQHAA